MVGFYALRPMESRHWKIRMEPAQVVIDRFSDRVDIGLSRNSSIPWLVLELSVWIASSAVFFATLSSDLWGIRP